MMGVGGDNSWGARPQSRHQLKPDVTQLAYTGKFKPEFVKLAQSCAREAAGK